MRSIGKYGLGFVILAMAIDWALVKVNSTTASIGELRVPTVTEKVSEWKNEKVVKAEEAGINVPLTLSLSGGLVLTLGGLTIAQRRFGVKINPISRTKSALSKTVRFCYGGTKKAVGTSYGRTRKVVNTGLAHKRKLMLATLIVSALGGYYGYEKYPEKVAEGKEWAQTHSPDEKYTIPVGSGVASMMAWALLTGAYKRRKGSALASKDPFYDTFVRTGMTKTAHQVAQDAVSKLGGKIDLVGALKQADNTVRQKQIDLTYAEQDLEESESVQEIAAQRLKECLVVFQQAYEALPVEERAQYAKNVQLLEMLGTL